MSIHYTSVTMAGFDPKPVFWFGYRFQNRALKTTLKYTVSTFSFRVYVYFL